MIKFLIGQEMCLFSKVQRWDLGPTHSLLFYSNWETFYWG